MKKQRFIGAAALTAMLVLILSPGTALRSASSGIQMCIRQLIPSLFPFIVVSGFLTAGLQGVGGKWLEIPERLFRIPRGSGVLLLTGLLGGYPLGARAVAQAYQQKQISRQQAERMISFCNNAGPSFLFGIVGIFFQSQGTLWLLWGLCITSSLAAAILLPADKHDSPVHSSSTGVSPSQIIRTSVGTMGIICGWVILFRVLLEFSNIWFLNALPGWTRLLFSGALELSNGCLMLGIIPNERIRMLFAGILLCFGGLCVTMQTADLCRGLSMRQYLKGKLIQVAVFTVLWANLNIRFLKFQEIVIVLDLLFVCSLVFSGFRKKSNSISAAVRV